MSKDDESVFAGLPADRYLSAAWFTTEMAKVFGRIWLYACHSSELAAPGAFVTRAIGPDERVVLLRTPGGPVRAFHNVCRHRGSPLCNAPYGQVERLICPYHQWTYGLDGRLLGAPRLRDGAGLHYAELGLHPVVVAEWRGHVFLHLQDGDPGELIQELEARCGGLSAFSPEETRVAHAVTYRVRANWKVLLENFWECYHCAPVHRALSRTLDVAALDGAEFGAHFEGVPPQVEAAGLPLKAGARTASLDGRLTSRALLGRFATEPVPDPGPSTGFILRATTAASYFVDYGILHDFRPVEVNLTEVLCQWLVRRDAVEGRDYDRAALVDLWERTNEEDWGLCEAVQTGMRSSRYTPGPLGVATEPGIRSFHQYYSHLMAATNSAPEDPAGATGADPA